jgi:hypothetical protein
MSIDWGTRRSVKGLLEVRRWPTHAIHASLPKLTLQTATLIVWFAAWDVVHVVILLRTPGSLGGDGRLYSHAAAAWLTGQDPWAVREWGFGFIGPPISLLPFALTAWLPLDPAGWLWVAIDVCAAAAVVRRLGLPRYWCLFPPLVLSTWVGSLEPVVLFLLVIGPRFLAPIAKIYTVFPLLGENRRRDLALSLGVVIVSAPLLPWAAFINEYQLIMATGYNEASSLSAWGQPILIALTVPSLVILGRRRAGYLVVPALWPLTLLHYSLMALPVLIDMPVMALAAATPFVPHLVALAIIFQAGITLIRQSPRCNRLASRQEDRRLGF